VDATTRVAIAGFATTFLTALIALVVPLVQGRVAAKNATAKRLEEQREAAYIDAVTYAGLPQCSTNGQRIDLEVDRRRLHRLVA
jgi:hypothetical protein